MLDKTAAALVNTCLGASPADRVCIVIDDHADSSLVHACWRELVRAECEPTLVRYAPSHDRPLHNYCRFAEASLRDVRLPRVVASALASADKALLITNDMDSMFAKEWNGLVAQGLRGLFLPYLGRRAAKRMLPKSEMEAIDLRDEVAMLAVRLKSAKTARLTSGGGTDLKMRLGQWAVRAHSGIADETGIQVLPAGQVTHVPDDGTAVGTLVVDRSIADNDYREVVDPIRFDVEDGWVTRILGGRDATRTASFLKSLGDPRAYHLTELGIGVNPRCRLTGVGAPTEDTHTRGAVSLALGCDVHIGGGQLAPVHIDMTMWTPTLFLDGEPVIQKGSLSMDGLTNQSRDG